MLELDCLGLSPSLITYQLCDMEQVALPLLASVSSLLISVGCGNYVR